MSGLARRLARLEARRPPCPACAEARLYVQVADGEAPVPDLPEQCPICGRRLARLYVAVDPDRV